MEKNNNCQCAEFNTVPCSDGKMAQMHIEKGRKVIPIIFLPGVMGSNLKAKPKKGESENTKIIWRLDSPISAAAWAIWIVGGPAARKKKLDPNKTEVDNRGTVTEAAEDEIRLFGTRRERGWGSVGYFSYGKFLETFQSYLYQPNGQLSSELTSLIGKFSYESLIDEAEAEAKSKSKSKSKASNNKLEFTKNEIEICKNYDFPLYVMGYNWLESNKISAERLKTFVDKTIGFYKERCKVCDKVILVTHSMGGLVARYYTEVLNEGKKVYGVINGVQPSTGSTVAYTRMKRGTEDNLGVARVLGDDAAKMTAVCAQSPGPLQLLPSIDYGEEWLIISSPQSKEEKYPKKSERSIYEQIYLNKKDWWCVCEPHLINPLNRKHNELQMQTDWIRYEFLIRTEVEDFHKNIAGKYHPNTYVFYGIDQDDNNISEELLTYEKVHWQGEFIDKGFSIFKKRPSKNYIGDKNRLNLKELNEHRTLKANATESKDNNIPGNIKIKYTLKKADGNGDGTVPKRSGEIPIEEVKVRMHIPVKHASPYDNAICQEFALRAIVDIIKEVNKDEQQAKT